MEVKSIRLINFRNYKNLYITLNNKLNIFLGNNAQGKTNLLESIYISSIGKSFRTSKDKELVNIEKEEAYIGLKLKTEEHDKNIEIKFEKNKNKRIKINRIEIDKLSELNGNLNIVIFSPEDLKIIKEGPSERRNFLDTEISQLRPYYSYNLNKYNKILYQRNNLLKNYKFNKEKMDLIEVWNEQLAKIGTEIIINRIHFVDIISKISKDIHSKLSGGLEDLNIEYLSSVDLSGIYDTCDENNPNLKSLRENIREKVFIRFKKLLTENIKKDIEKNTTSIGPHRDDIKVIVNDLDSRIYGSQGQQRTAALSLKLAEVELIKGEIGEYPVLLLDDVLSELDINRRRFLIDTFKDIQTIITSTDDIDLKDVSSINKSIFYIENGEIVDCVNDKAIEN